MTMVRDVVCGMDIQAETAVDSSQYQDHTFYFCSSECKRAFDQDPEHYLEPYRTWDNPSVLLFMPIAAAPAAQPIRPL